MKTLGSRLKELRGKRRWTLNEVAAKLGLRGHSTYSNWEYDRTEPDTEMLTRIAELYGVTVDWLTGRKLLPNDVTNENISDVKKDVIGSVISMTEEDAKFIKEMYDRMKKE